ADAYGRHVARDAIGQQAAALGAALVAGVGAGVWPDFSILDSISRADAEVAPDAEAAADYARRYARWRALTDKLGAWASQP
ncbi:MAG: xylulokinase, partial [Kiritimatiellae bacterium]|nr:xylulokinase [Kiritimatiellia bacterium]